MAWHWMGDSHHLHKAGSLLLHLTTLASELNISNFTQLHLIESIRHDAYFIQMFHNVSTKITVKLHIFGQY